MAGTRTKGLLSSSSQPATPSLPRPALLSHCGAFGAGLSATSDPATLGLGVLPFSCLSFIVSYFVLLYLILNIVSHFEVAVKRQDKNVINKNKNTLSQFPSTT